MSARVCIMRIEYKKPVTFGVSYIGIIILIYPQSQKLEVTYSTTINLRLGSEPGALQRLYSGSLTNTVTKSYQHLYG